MKYVVRRIDGTSEEVGKMKALDLLLTTYKDNLETRRMLKGSAGNIIPYMCGEIELVSE